MRDDSSNPALTKAPPSRGALSGRKPLLESGLVSATRRSIPASHLMPALVAIAGIATFASLMLGGAEIPPHRVLSVLWESLQGRITDETAARIVLDIRLPRVLLALAIGSGMGLAGLASQTLFRNPLASPYVLGVSNGAAVGAVFAMLLVGKAITYSVVPIMSVAGGLCVSLTVFGLSRRSDHFGHSLLLAGIAISAFCSALTSATLYLAGERLPSLVFWLMGGLWLATWRDVVLMLPVTLAVLLSLLLLAPAMNVALVGERSAGDLGVNVRRLQIFLLLTICVTTSVGVAVSGVIGFVGLIVPHLLRLVMGSDHRELVPSSALGGAILLLVSDTLARTLAAPAEIPVGVITALVGAPIFLWLLQRSTPGGGWA